VHPLLPDNRNNSLERSHVAELRCGTGPPISSFNIFGSKGIPQKSSEAKEEIG
jgi:hypothetical protein